jgi:hypothetical protein
VIAARVAVAALVLAVGPARLTLSGSPQGIVASVHPAAAGVAVHWRVVQSDQTVSGTTKTDAHGRVVIAVDGAALSTGTVDVRAGSAHTRRAFCLDPHDVAVVGGQCYGDFTGRWSGQYQGRFFGQGGCKDWPIEGPVQLQLAQRGRTVTGTITLVGSALKWDDNCRVFGHDDDVAPVQATVTGATATGGTLSLSIDVTSDSVSGSVNAKSGTLTFSADRY